MKPTTFLTLLAPAAVLASSPPATAASSDFAHSSPAVSIPGVAHPHFIPLVDHSAPPSGDMSIRAASHVLQARSDGSLGQTPWIGMAIGLTFTALAAVMLG